MSAKTSREHSVSPPEPARSHSGAAAEDEEEERSQPWPDTDSFYPALLL